MKKNKKVIILHICDIKNTKANGVASVLPKCIYYQNKQTPTALWDLRGNFITKGINIIKDRENISNLPEPFNKPDLIVFHELYKLSYIRLSKYCIDNNIPYIIIPHGCLVKKAQKQKWLKKRLVNMFFYKKILNKSAAIQFLNNREKEQTKIKIKHFIVSGFGIDIPKLKNKTKNTIRFIYIGRYSIYTKGLDLLFDVCVKNQEWFRKNKIEIVLYGRISSDKDNDIFLYAKKNNIDDFLKVNGPIYGEEKLKILSESYAFIQTSRHEAQPQGIMEALAIGLPCVVTEGTSFSEYVNEKKCGIGVKFDFNQFFTAMKQIVENKEVRDEYSKNAIKCSRNDFDWQKAIFNMLENYMFIVRGE